MQGNRFKQTKTQRTQRRRERKETKHKAQMVKAKRVCPHLTSRITLFIALRPLRLCALCV
jgi:hypothetical protein